MEKKRKNPIGIRFDEGIVQVIMKREGLKTYQSVVNFLLKWYDQRFNPIEPNPVLERNTPYFQHQPSFEPKKIKTFHEYLKQIRYLEEENECREFVSEVTVDSSLTRIQKDTLINSLKSKWA